MANFLSFLMMILIMIMPRFWMMCQETTHSLKEIFPVLVSQDLHCIFNHVPSIIEKLSFVI